MWRQSPQVRGQGGRVYYNDSGWNCLGLQFPEGLPLYPTKACCGLKTSLDSLSTLWMDSNAFQMRWPWNSPLDFPGPHQPLSSSFPLQSALGLVVWYGEVRGGMGEGGEVEWLIKHLSLVSHSVKLQKVLPRIESLTDSKSHYAHFCHGHAPYATSLRHMAIETKSREAEHLFSPWNAKILQYYI